MKCLKTSHLRYSGVPCFTTIAKDGKYSCFVDSDLGVGPDVNLSSESPVQSPGDE